MPEFTVKEVRLPELHLPEIKRDEIVRALSGIRVPEVDLAEVEPRRRLRGINLHRHADAATGLAGVDAGKLVAAAITAARIVRPAAPHARWSPFRQSRCAAVGRSREHLVGAVRPTPRRSRAAPGGRASSPWRPLAAGWCSAVPPSRSRLDRAARRIARRASTRCDRGRSGTWISRPVSRSP